MTKQEILSKVDHTLLKPEARWQDVQALCDEALAAQTASVCINPCHVKRAAEYLGGRVPVCTVIGFPLGAATMAAKQAEARDALQNGADELDMVINIGALKAGDEAYVCAEIRALKEVAGTHILKVIIETCLLTDQEKIAMCRLIAEAGADFIKTSTGFSTGGATFADIELIMQHKAPETRVKASGGIRSVADMEQYLGMGVDRLGTSSAIKLLENQQTGGSY